MTGFCGLLLTSATGASAQWMPTARASRAVTSPMNRAASSEPDAPIAIAYGSGTTPRRTRKDSPRSRSAETSSGTFARSCSSFSTRGRLSTSDSNTTSEPTPSCCTSRRSAFWSSWSGFR